MSLPIGYNSANYNSDAIWNGANGNVTSVGTNGGQSAYGTTDQSGNVWEWTEQLIEIDQFIYADIFGGAWNTDANSLSCYGKNSINYLTLSNNIGFRLVSFDVSSTFLSCIDIGDISNNADSRTGLGSVAYSYRIMLKPITNLQYVVFLNSVDPNGSNSYGLYSSLMSRLLNGNNNPRGGINFIATNPSGSKYVVKNNFHNKPINYVSFLSAARMCNWLHNGQSPTNINDGAYTIIENTVIIRNNNAKYALPTLDEWYKSAFYDTNKVSKILSGSSNTTVCPDGIFPGNVVCCPEGGSAPTLELCGDIIALNTEPLFTKQNGLIDGYWTYATQSDSPPCSVGSVGCTPFDSSVGNGGVINVDPTPTPTPTITVSPTTSLTPTPTQSIGASQTPTPTQTQTPTSSITPTITITPTLTPTISNSPTQTPTISLTPTKTPTRTPTTTPTITPSITPTKTQTRTPTKTPTRTPTVTPTKTVTASVTPSITPTISVTPSKESCSSPTAINKIYDIKEYPKDAEFSVSLLSPPSGLENNIFVKEWHNFIRNISTIYGGPNNTLFFNTITSGNNIIPNDKSTLTQLDPGKPYYFILKDNAELPLSIPVINKLKSNYLSNTLINQINSLSINNTKIKSLEGNRIAYIVAIEALKEDIKEHKNNNRNRQELEALLESITQEYIENGNDCNKTITNSKNCLNYYISNDGIFSYKEVLPIDSYIESNTISISGNGNTTEHIDVILSGLPDKNSYNISYYFRLKDATQSCSIFPLSGIISPDQNNTATISSIFEFCVDSIRGQYANLLKATPTPTPTLTPTITLSSTPTPTPTTAE
jgi:formylglycine-generating enzyme required for sulfatase activity